MIKIHSLAIGSSALAALASIVILAPAQAKTTGVTLTNSVLVQHKSAAADGTTRITLVPANHVVPGDRVVFRTVYKNHLAQPVSGMVVSNPVPANISYHGPAEGSPAPEVSIDGAHFAPLAALTVAGRPARADQVRAVRWLVHGQVPAGAAARYSYEASVK
ncbi:hypothetical protein HNO88_002226 [Novosphingobium chloroacetimidivorans]|uniref:DUF11 domain-containing protein n=1 Tax=Novosphingobium chloroacetimidivorans TaxID=1428314 RepID=A0A7W7KAB1_9SPHN|nr:hypothetical protein [Novosphingobium chloroacetimidivorans]MBB4858900.1 hypothetical protein [Novosphingobium chloroacetimidivorans]